MFNSRLWVLQEVALANYNLCLFGQHKVELEHVLLSAKWLCHKPDLLDEELFHSAGLGNAATMFNHTRSYHSVHAFQRFKPDILRILSNDSRGLSCGDPRDKIYAVLGLLDWTEHGSLPPELAPDYSRSVTDVLTMAASWAIRSNQWEVTNKLLRQISHRSSEDMYLDGLPSWVPRWHRNVQLEHDPARFRERKILRFARGKSSVKQGSAGLAASSRWIVNGIQIEVMQEVAMTQETWSWDNFAEDYVKPLQRFLDLSGSGMARDVSGVILSADTWSDFTSLSEDNRRQLAQWLEQEMESARPFSKASSLSKGCDKALSAFCAGQYDICISRPTSAAALVVPDTVVSS